jgi:phosphatidate cytidylyltransferase
MAAPGGTGRGTRRGRRERGSGDLTKQIKQTREDIRAQVRATRVQFDEANARINARTGRNLVPAIAVGLLLGVVLIGSVVWLKQLFVLLVVVLVGFSAYELAGALRTAGRRVPRIGSAVGAVLVQPIAYFLSTPSADCRGTCTGVQRIGDQFPAGWLLAVLGAVVLAVVWRLVQHAQQPVAGRQLVLDLGETVFVQLYITLLGSCATVLTAQDGGQWWALTFISVVVATDVFAYASGLLLGKHPMAPRISPKKTWEGFAGSGLAAVVVASVLSPLLLGEPIWFGLVLGLTMLVTGTVGDLTESLVKRDIGVKDISGRLPGHGGFLDRIDGILPSAAAALLLFLVAH